MSGRGGSTEGQATVELALALPLILGLLLFAVQTGLVIHDRLMLAHAAREAARAAAVVPTVAAAGDAAVRATRLDADRMEVGVRRTGPGRSLVEVTVTYRSPTEVPMVGPLLGDITMSESVTMMVEQG